MSVIERAKAIWSLFTDGRMTRLDKIILVAALGYCLSPVDIIPDVVPVVGFLDDLLVVMMSLRHFSRRAGADTAPVAKEENFVEVDARVV